MSCPRAFDIDLAAFLGNPREPEFAAFVDHYPRCADCSAEVRAWTELEAQLRDPATGTSAHPAPALLARFVEAPNALEPGERGPLDAHLASCPVCRDEVSGLRRFVEAGTPALSRPRAGESDSAIAGGSGLLAGLRRLVWQPGFAYAALGLVLVSTLFRTVGPDGVVRDEVYGVAQPDSAPSIASESQATRPAPSSPGRADLSLRVDEADDALDAAFAAEPKDTAQKRAKADAEAAGGAKLEAGRTASADFAQAPSLEEEIVAETPRMDRGEPGTAADSKTTSLPAPGADAPARARQRAPAEVVPASRPGVREQDRDRAVAGAGAGAERLEDRAAPRAAEGLQALESSATLTQSAPPTLVLGRNVVATASAREAAAGLRIRVPLPTPARGGELAACYLLAEGEEAADASPALARRLADGERWLDVALPAHRPPGRYRAVLLLESERVSELEFRISAD